jgi:hypothetical protein
MDSRKCAAAINRTYRAAFLGKRVMDRSTFIVKSQVPTLLRHARHLAFNNLETLLRTVAIADMVESIERLNCYEFDVVVDFDNLVERAKPNLSHVRAIIFQWNYLDVPHADMYVRLLSYCRSLTTIRLRWISILELSGEQKRFVARVCSEISTRIESIEIPCLEGSAFGRQVMSLDASSALCSRGILLRELNIGTIFTFGKTDIASLDAGLTQLRRANPTTKLACTTLRCLSNTADEIVDAAVLFCKHNVLPLSIKTGTFWFRGNDMLNAAGAALIVRQLPLNYVRTLTMKGRIIGAEEALIGSSDNFTDMAGGTGFPVRSLSIDLTKNMIALANLFPRLRILEVYGGNWRSDTMSPYQLDLHALATRCPLLRELTLIMFSVHQLVRSVSDGGCPAPNAEFHHLRDLSLDRFIDLDGTLPIAAPNLRLCQQRQDERFGTHHDDDQCLNFWRALVANCPRIMWVRTYCTGGSEAAHSVDWWKIAARLQYLEKVSIWTPIRESFFCKYSADLIGAMSACARLRAVYFTETVEDPQFSVRLPNVHFMIETIPHMGPLR